MTVLFSFRDVSAIRRRRPVLTGLNWDLRAGTLHGLVGPNGAGKTTAMEIAAGLLPSYGGEVVYDGATLPPQTSLAARARRGIGYLPQGGSAFRRLSVQENLMAVPGADVLRAAQIAEAVGLGALRGVRAEDLSGGERRRLEIGRLLLLRARLLLCDEPFAGLDPLGVTDLSRLLQAIAADGCCVVVTDHQVEAVFSLCSRVAVLLDGRLHRDAPPEVLRRDPVVQSRYLGR